MEGNKANFDSTFGATETNQKNTRVLKLHLRLEPTNSLGGGNNTTTGHYRSFLITSNETFYSLKLRTLDKINMKRSDLPFCTISIYFQYPFFQLHQRGPLYPSDHEIIASVLDREELYHEGELLVVFSDMRINFASSDIQTRSESTFSTQGALALDTCTEFNQSYPEEIVETIPATLLAEIESISLKIGRLQIFHSGKDPWRDVEVLLTDDTLWYNYVNDPLHFLVSIPLPRQPIPYPDSDSTTIFTIPGTTTTTTLFRAKSRHELNIWIDSINSRSLLCSENDVIFMAEELCSMGENRRSCRDIDFLSECASFEGTLRNSYLRETFRSFLTSNVSQESLLFWEYAEDFRRGHPNSKQPLISLSSQVHSSSPHTINSQAVETELPLRQWATAIYECFIADGSSMQVAIPGEAKSLIEKTILDKSMTVDSELFKVTQNQLFNHLKFQLFPTFVQNTSYRGILMSSLRNKVHQCPVTGQIWSHSSTSSSPLLLSSPPSLFPSFFSPRLYSRTHRPYNFLSQAAADPEREHTNGTDNLASNPPVAAAETTNPWVFGRLITKFRTGMKNSGNSSPHSAATDQFSEFSSQPLGGSGSFVTIRSGSVPTPWREKIVANPTKPPLWLPQYWWTHVDFSNEIYFAYDDSYDASLMKMLPRWMQAIAKRRRSDGKVTSPQRRSVLSTISSIIREAVYRESDNTTPTTTTTTTTFDSPTPHEVGGSQYRKIRSETFVNEFSPSSQSDDNFLEYHTSGHDVIAHLPPSTIQSTTNFSSHRGGIAALGKNQSMVSNPYEEDVDLRNESWQCIPVPHLPKSLAYRQRLPRHAIVGPIIQCALMTTRYSGVIIGSPTTGSLNFPVSPTTSSSYSQSMDYQREDSLPLDTPISPTVSGVGAYLSTDVERLVVLTSREDREGGELRLFDLSSFQLCAIIRLCCVTQIIPSTSLLHTIEIHDITGSVWYLHPGEIHPNQGTSGAKFWLQLLAQHCSSGVHTALICHEGYLGKRGQFNTAYKRRWFVLDSEQKLRYFIRWDNGQSRLKGEVDVETINDVAVIGKDLRLATDDRIWFYQADTEDEAAFWKVVLSSLIPLKHGIISTPQSDNFM